MKLLVAAVFGLLIGQVVPSEPESSLLDPINKLTATALLGAIIFWLLGRTIPAVEKAYRDTLDKICDRNAERDKALLEVQKDLQETVRTMIGHCPGPANKPP